MSLLSSSSDRQSKIVTIDDDPLIQRLLGVLLKPLNPELLVATDGCAGVDLVLESHPDLVLIDYHMPGLDGLEAVTKIRKHPDFASIPIIFATGSNDDKTITESFAAGATDYVRKPFCRAELMARVTASLERQYLVNELTIAARLDKLTGLPNRALLYQRLESALARYKRAPGYQFAVMFLDFDRFKFVNDSLGHDVGDELLKAIADRLRENLRPSDSIALDSQGHILSRIGGDEFVVLLDNIDSPSNATIAAERLLQTLNRPYELGPHTVNSTASIGIVCADARYQSADEILRDADTAMYEAKARGKARAIVFSPEMQQAIDDQLQIENDLRKAIGTEQFSLVFQPIVSLDDGEMHGCEALVRWCHPTKGMISPQQFIPIAEENGLILPISEWVLDAACKQFRALMQTKVGSHLKYISVNLSHVQLNDPKIKDQIMSTLARNGVEPQQLQLEVTESEIMRNPASTIALLQNLKSQGIRLAMDDFGTGHSSLSCLHEYPFDVVKIDRSFIKNFVGGSREFASLLHAMVGVVTNLNMACVGEGVETQDQLTLLQAMGCEFGQGRYFAMPVEQANLTCQYWRQGQCIVRRKSA